MLREFRDFVARGNVLDLAVAVIIGAAFAKITTSLTEDVIMPLVGRIFGGLDFSSKFILLGPIPADYHGAMTYAALKEAGVPVLGWGAFVTVIDQFPDPRLHHLPAGARGEQDDGEEGESAAPEPRPSRPTWSCCARSGTS